VAQNYFALQTDMSPRIRAVLVDWIIEIHLKYKMQPLTLWMIINVFDRFLATTFMSRNRLQLAAIVSLFICCKFEEVHTPDVKDCLFLTDNTYTRADIVLTEAMILHAINYEMTVPTPYHFLIRIFRRIKASDRLKSICYYIAERNLHECDILEISPRIYASACVLAGLYTLYSNFEESVSPKELWTDILHEESGLTLDEILSCSKQLLVIMNIPLQPSTRRKVEAALRKYSMSANHYVAALRYPTISEPV
jgi:cyclin B